MYSYLVGPEPSSASIHCDSASSKLCPACCGQLVKILITPEPYGIFGSNVAYLFILILSSHPDMQNGGEGLPSIIFAAHGLLEKKCL